MTLRSEIAKLRRVVEARVAAARKEQQSYRQVVHHAYLGPLTAQQQRDLDYNHSLQNPARVGFSLITIKLHPDPDIQPATENDLVN